MSVLQVQGLSVQFQDQYAAAETVQGLSFRIEAGEILGIVGESGSGKSTAAQALMGLLPDKAKVTCDRLELCGQQLLVPSYKKGRPDKREQRIYEKKMQNIRGSKVAMVFQDPLSYLNPTVKIERQITETIRIHKPRLCRAEAKQQAAKLLDLVGIRFPWVRMKQFPFELSGGMRQRVAIAIALAGEPQLIIADEPTTALDVTIKKQILQLLARIADETGTAVLLVSHDLGVIASLCSRVLVMHNGRVEETGTVEQIFHDPQMVYTKQLIGQACRLEEIAPKKSMNEKGQTAQNKVPLLTLQHVTKQYKKGQPIPAVWDVSFSIGKGETFGLVGESGCGKTTLAEMITGIHKPTSGKIFYEGQVKEGMSRQIQMVFQDPYASLNPRMTIAETLEEPLLLNTKLSALERKTKREEILRLTGLSAEDGDKYPRAFSGGQRQRIGIARALMLRPDLIVCDEPVSSLDLTIQEQILELLESIQNTLQVTYLFISHDLNVVKRVSHHIGVMYAGKLVETGATKEVYEDPWHPYTKELLSSILTANLKVAQKRRKKAKTEESRAIDSEKQGCCFVGRCGYAMECCRTSIPQTYQFKGRFVSCFLYSKDHTASRSNDYKMTSQI